MLQMHGLMKTLKIEVDWRNAAMRGPVSSDLTRAYLKLLFILDPLAYQATSGTSEVCSVALAALATAIKVANPTASVAAVTAAITEPFARPFKRPAGRLQIL